MGEAADVVRRFVELYNDGSPDDYGSDAPLQLYAKDVDWAMGPSTFVPQFVSGDLEAIRGSLAANRSLFRDRRIEIDEIVEEGNRAAWIGTWSATVGVEGLPLGPVGTRLRIPIATVIEVREGLIVRAREFMTAPLGS